MKLSVEVEILQSERDRLAADVRRVPELKDRIAQMEARFSEMKSAYGEFEELKKRVEEKLEKS